MAHRVGLSHFIFTYEIRVCVCSYQSATTMIHLGGSGLGMKTEFVFKLHGA